ncbi:hypothetical protein ABDB91_15195 [Desulfoscipio sp. XC116]|uniref:hypothetical protein n=1 Tax=Desulfoscipio sp. XC116 TaxID=3144975 RepID=UPI00325ABA3E
MGRLIIEPHIGIGKVKLGMSRKAVHEIMGMNFESLKRDNILIDLYYESCFQVNYNKEGVVNFIEIADGIIDNFKVVFKDIEIFKTKANDLVSYFEKISKYNKDDPDAVLGFMYIFEDIGVSLWRPNVFKEEILHEPWFQQLEQEDKEYELKFQYFESVSIWSKGYYD